MNWKQQQKQVGGTPSTGPLREATSRQQALNLPPETLSEPSKAQASASKNKIIASGIRHELVNKFRDILKNGSYEVKANEIADKIVQKIRENKNHLIL